MQQVDPKEASEGLENPVPDSSRATVETVPCPLCDYNLRGLTEPRCPECGYRFEWIEVLDPNLRPPWYLFEHAKQRLVRSFLMTQAVGVLPPLLFGKVLRPTYRVVTHRLLLYWILAAGSFVLTPLVIIAVPSIWYLMGNAPTFSAAIYDLPSAINQWLREHPGFAPAASATLILWLAWPWLTLLVLFIFRDSMNKANVKAAHVQRCVVYSCAAGLLMGAVASALYFLTLDSYDGAFHLLASILGRPAALPVVMSGVFAIVVAFRLAHAYALYLRFPHAIATAVLSQVVVFLVGWLFAAAVWGLTDRW